MRPTDILGTTSVRLGSLFLALFGAASLALFGFMHWQTHGFMTARTDEWLVREQGIFGPLAPTELAERLEQHAAEDPYLERPFTLFDAAGRRITGSAIAKPPMTALGHAADFEAPWKGRTAPFRGLMQRLPSGDLLLVAQDVRAQHEFDERLTSAMLWGGLGAAVIGVAGSVAAGIGAVRRLDALTRAIQRTVAGGLSSRLPVQGAGGDMARLVHVVNRMLDDIERLMHEVKGVCDNIAHDLRTPLTRLLAGLERVSRRGGAVKAYQAAVDEAIDETKGLLRTFGALLRISEVEAGARRSGFATVDLAQVASDVIDFYEPVAEAQGIGLDRVYQGGLATMPGDPSLLFEALANLVDNAIKFTPRGGRVQVSTTHAADGASVAVVDSGPGIPSDQRDQVLRRFHRLEASRNAPGSGLGLSLVAAIARLHGMQLVISDANPGCLVAMSFLKTPFLESE